MSERTTIYREDEYRDQDLMVVVRRIMLEGHTGEVTLHLSQGRVLSVVKRTKQREGNGKNGHLQIPVDTISV